MIRVSRTVHNGWVPPSAAVRWASFEENEILAQERDLLVHQGQGSGLWSRVSVLEASSGVVQATLGVEDLLDGVAGHGVEEEHEDGGQQQDDDDLDDDPLVIVPQDVPQRLEWVQEPDEGGVRATVETKNEKSETDTDRGRQTDRHRLTNRQTDR